MRIYIDFEATEAGEIIAVGAVTENNDRFFRVCRPLYTPVTERITALTGLDSNVLADEPTFRAAAEDLIHWCDAHSTTIGFHFFSFGKNDHEFLAKTIDLYKAHSFSAESIACMQFVYNNLSNGAYPIYKAFNRPLIGLRSAYLTYKNNKQELPDSHNPVDDAAMFKELVEAAESGWTLPEDAEIVKVVKPILPAKAPVEDFNTPAELHRTVVCYWTKGNKDKVAVYRDLVSAAKALCTKALNSGVTPEVAANRILTAAIAGETYCDRKFFLVN